MKKLFWIFLFCVINISLQAQSEAALMNAVKAKLGKVRDYQAAGVMSVDAAFIKAPASAIKVYFKAPDKFAIKKQDGISILPKGGISINLASLLGSGNATAIGAGNATVNGIATKVIKLLPLDAASDVVLYTLYIDAQKSLVQKTEVTTRDNGSYEMDFTYGRYAAWGLPDKVVFTFNTKEYKIPKGITFEYEKGGAKKPPASKDNKGRVVIQYSSYTINKGVDGKVFGK